MTAADFIVDVPEQSRLPTMIALIWESPRSDPSQDPIRAIRNVLIKQVGDSIGKLNQTPVSIRRSKMARQRLEFGIVAPGIEMSGDSPAQPIDVPLRIRPGVVAIGNRCEDEIKKASRKGKVRIRQHAVFACDGLCDPAFHPRTLYDDVVGREWVAARGHQATRQTVEESLHPIAAFDE